MRFHFNAHNLIVYGRDGGDYLVSDPVFEDGVRCDRAALMKARFAKGALAGARTDVLPGARPAHDGSRANDPRGDPRELPDDARSPLPFVGLRGIRRMGRSLVRLGGDPRRRDDYFPRLLGHIVRMQEEIGTGGAGFRFMYGAFLRESSALLDDAPLREASERMTEAGDTWRLFALRASKMCKGREPMDPPLLADIIFKCADREAAAWNLLRRVAPHR
jgi:hypothetical protein